MANTNNPPQKEIRCAIYTRKSTEEGLEQSFNSLDAQRDAGESYVRSQTGEGWSIVPTQYDDGGYTGANMDRPALRRLMADSQAGKVDCVVVYKVDRLSRNIRDFAKIMEVFDKHGTTFVSVTQQFNTTTSLGRLTLNILLSFAQFEREIISERTKDKQSAARKRGKWTGGHLVLGYDLDEAGRLVINEKEAERVRLIFQSYLEGESVFSLQTKAARHGWRNKQWVTRDGKQYGGRPMGRCHFYSMLGNVLYTGQLRVDDALYPGEHEAIIDRATFDLVQAKLRQSTIKGERGHRSKMESMLRGMIYCSCCGSAMYQTYSSSKERRYRYYICSKAAQANSTDCTSRSVSAPAVEQAVVTSIQQVSLHPKVLEETSRVIRQRLTEDINRLREELKNLQVRLKNFKSQVVRLNPPDFERRNELDELIRTGELRVAELKRTIAAREKKRLGGDDVEDLIEPFDQLWKAMNVREQGLLLRQLVEKVGYEGRTGKVTVSFKSTGLSELCKRGGRL